MRSRNWLGLVYLAAVLATALGAQRAGADAGCGDRQTGSGPKVRVIGLTDDQRLVRFRECGPENTTEIGAISGLVGSDTMIVGIDFRVQDGMLYGVGNGGGIYTIDPASGAAMLASQLSVALDPGTSFAVDFNPAANRLRILNGDTGQNLRHDLTVQPGVTTLDGPLAFTPAAAAVVSGAAYVNNDLAGDTGTTLFDIDATGNRVAVQSPPNAGSLVAAGLLTVDPDSPVGFDIYSRLQDGVTIQNSAFASLIVGGVNAFYRVNLLTGKASFIGMLGDSVVDIAIPLDQ